MIETEAALLGVERSLGGRRWRARAGDDRRGLALAQQLGVPEVIGRLLAARGVDADRASRFLSPTLRDWLPDPSRLQDLDRAVARLVSAITKGERIALFGDYDVDGATSTALVARYLTAVGAPPRLYIPDRIAEGYGPNQAALLALQAEGIGLVVTLDCGTTAFEPLAAAAAAGLDLIVIDHHAAEPRLPAAVAVINPNRLDDDSGVGNLAAVGVAFVVLVGLNRGLKQAGVQGLPDLLQFLDLVALGTVCDVVPLVGLNRAFVAQGIRVLAGRRNTGLAALADSAGIGERLDAYHLGFVLGPRVNAGGRVGRADLGARLLTLDDEAEARRLAQELEGHNAERRQIESQVLAEALAGVERAAEAGEGPGPILIADGDHWHPGVIGIVASRLKDRFNRPACVIAWAGDLGKGSGRSVPGFDLGAAIIAARQAGLLTQGGGHPMAAGFTIERPKLGPFRRFLAERSGAGAGPSAAIPELGVDGVLQLGAATSELCTTLAQMGPFGAGNSEPRFVIPGVTIVRADVVGAGHVRLILTAAGTPGRLKAIAFRAMEGALGPALLKTGGMPLHVAGHLRPDHWQGQSNLQFFLEDAAPAIGSA